MGLPSGVLRSIAIVEEDPTRATELQLLIWQEREIRAQIHIVTDEPSANQVFASLTAAVPDVLFVNESLWEVGGFEFANRLTKDVDTGHAWVLMVGEFQELLTKQKQARYCGAEWYVARPYDAREVLRELDHGFFRVDQILIDKTTYLPGNKQLEIIEKRVFDSKLPVAFVSGDINDFGQLNYISEKTGDDALRRYGGIAKSVVNQHGGFVGQLSGSDNIGILCSPEDAVFICQEISRRFELVLSALYGEETYNQGYVEVAGERKRLVSISWGISSNIWHEGKFSFSVFEQKVECRTNQNPREHYYWWQLHTLANQARTEAKALGKSQGVGWILISSVEPFEGLNEAEKNALRKSWLSNNKSGGV